MKSPIQILADIGSDAYSKQSGRKIIGICGQGGAGKTTLCRKVISQAEYPCAVFEIDWYLRNSSQDRRSAICKAMTDSLPEIEFWRDPTNWYDWFALRRDLFVLRDHGTLKASSLWRQTTGEKDLEIDIHLPENGVIFCDGIYLLHQPVVDWLDTVVVLEVACGTALERSAARDAHRNDGIYQRFKESVANEFDQPYFAKNHGAAGRVISL